MDLDIDMDDAAVADAFQDTHETHEHIPQGDDILVPDEPEEPGEVADDGEANEDDASNTIVPTKIHIRGLDNLHTDDIKAYVKAHYGNVDRVEWIDDSTANLVFNSEPTAREAIVALSAIDIADATALSIGETIPAKALEGKPEVSLQVRFATLADRKQAGAALRSRYYLLHPEHDPEERRRRYQENRSRYRDRDHDHRGGGGGRRRRYSDEEVETFEASMYDDAPQSSKDDRSDRSGSNARGNNRGKELFADRAVGRSSNRRGRSASPRRDDDGDAAMDGLASSSSNRTQARSIRGRLASDAKSKELFPTKPSNRGGQLDQLEEAIGSARLKEEDMPKVVARPDEPAGEGLNIRGVANQRTQGKDSGFSIKGAANARELFPGKFGSGNAGKELLDMNRSKRRQKAEDLFS
ncbi:uncharacterized protein TRIVIDRAFT_51460 [Trichoderma virens Gv29-8]|uniref:Uncharacterized protein n=1 Tax=Hypocrea virens (strain Gv29-8 / FGSC 10586) TaxID=413071 RepID=G9NDQ7_HYPVG|nr:uncharacterized protein TRIVIDRAFT_51460 [Trichoderma virens Gv29-8]EHK15158.1 hypothetical protein TRIVIDRAFT_51460 [Trichoderma virens Gv29-8]UKZ57995.1 hypothetical protein TrVGV298_011856 [Trichoderma virens]